MADRFHVAVAAMLAVVSLHFLPACAAEAQQATRVKMSRGRVIDAATGQGIPGAYVVARYETTYGAHNQSACPWMEGAKADEQGWFELPVYERYGLPILRAFSPGYVRARSKRSIRAEIKEGKQVWYVAVLESDDGREFRRIVGREPGTYRTWQEAGTASREWIDAYLRKARPSQDNYINELQRLAGHPNCGRTRSAREVHAVLDAIPAEEVAVGAPKDNLEYLLRIKALVRDDQQGSR